jgi:hypothetical protein
MNLLKYSNGWGHLIMSVVSMVTGLLLILLTTGAMTRGIGTGLILTVQGYWFVTASAKQTAAEIVTQMKEQKAGEPSA